MKKVVPIILMLFGLIMLLCACDDAPSVATPGDVGAGTTEPTTDTRPADTPAPPEPPKEPGILDGLVFPREDEVYTEQINAVIAAAQAYFDHKLFVQYDQLNMNRVTKTDPRYEFVTPETANYQRHVYMECGVYTRNVYNNVFGYTTPKAGVVLAADYPNTKGERVFYWVGKPNQTEEHAQRGYREMLETIQPGDIIYYNYVKNKHIMLYIGGGSILQCSNATGGGDYQYASKTDKTEAVGGLFHAELVPYLAKKNLFAPENKVCLLRPTMLGLEMREDARIRAEKLQDIVINKTSSLYLGNSVNPGDCVTVTVKLENKRTEPALLDLSELLPEGFEYVSGCFDSAEGKLSTSVSLPAGGCAELSYTLRVKADVKPQTVLNCDGARVEGMYLSNQPIYVANTLTQTEQEALTALGRVEAATYAQLISGFYPDRDMSKSSWDPGELLSSMFTDFGLGKKGSTVTLASLQTSLEGMCIVPGMYGGQNCNSISNQHDSRIRRVVAANLTVG
ncbi:MAG: DUF11 domain-containing protein, partial [Clostridia bacterium]|nr:DUF11 domain-containing protein [Clostridia bacterium]